MGEERKNGHCSGAGGALDRNRRKNMSGRPVGQTARESAIVTNRPTQASAANGGKRKARRANAGCSIARPRRTQRSGVP